MKDNRELFYKILLLVCALIWGSTFVIIKDTTNTMSSGFINAARFTIGSFILLIVYFKKIKHINKHELKYGFFMGITLFGGYYLQVLGMELGSTAGKCSFLSATFSVMIPFLYWAIFHKKPDKFVLAAAIMCVIGVAFVSIEKDSHITIGDIVILISSFFYAVNVMLTSEFSSKENTDTTRLTFLQLLVVAIMGWIVVFSKNEFPQVYTKGAVFSLIYLGVFATALCLLIQVIALKNIKSTTSASILLSLESVFGVIISILWYNEVITFKLTLGFIIIFMGIITCETKWSFITDKFKVKNIKNREYSEVI